MLRISLVILHIVCLILRINMHIKLMILIEEMRKLRVRLKNLSEVL